MNILILSVGLLLSQMAWAGACEDMVKVIDPSRQDTNRAAVIGKLSFTFRAPAPNAASECSIGVSDPVTKRSYIFSDDGSIGISDYVYDPTNKANKDSKKTRFRSYMLLPQEKGKNFSATRNGKFVSIRMNSGEFIFDTQLGKIIPSPSLDVQDSRDGIKINNPRALWVDFGSAMGEDPRSRPALSTTVFNRSSSCQVRKEEMHQKISKWDQIMKLRTEADQIAFFKKSCVGTPFEITKLAPTNTRKSKLEDVMNSLSVPAGEKGAR